MWKGEFGEERRSLGRVGGIVNVVRFGKGGRGSTGMGGIVVRVVKVGRVSLKQLMAHSIFPHLSVPGQWCVRFFCRIGCV